MITGEDKNLPQIILSYLCSDYSELNGLLAERCQAYGGHHIQGKNDSVGEMFRKEQAALRPLPLYPFETAKCRSGRAILNAAPVRQNLPEEILKQIRTCGPKERIRILRRYCGNPEPKAPAVTDTVLVRPVDLRRYDALAGGKAVTAHVR